MKKPNTCGFNKYISGPIPYPLYIISLETWEVVYVNKAAKKRIILKSDIKYSKEINADYLKLIQVLNILISNAAKFTKP